MAVNGLEHLPLLVEGFDGLKTLKHNCLILETGKKRENENPDALQ